MQFSLHEADWEQLRDVFTLTQWLKHAASVSLRLKSILQYPLKLFWYKRYGQNSQLYLHPRLHAGHNLAGISNVENFWNFFFLEESTCDLRFCVRGSRVHEKATNPPQKVWDAILGQRGCSSDPVWEEGKLNISTWKLRGDWSWRLEHL